MRNWNYIIWCWVFWPYFLSGQQISTQLKISGYVLADDTGQPLAFARLSIGGNEVGTLSNEQGQFVLKIPERFIYDSLTISYLGYQTRIIALREIEKDTITIRLSNQDMTLEPVVILSISPEDTLKKAWRLRGFNYETRPTLLRGYYREEMEDDPASIQFLFAEGVLELYKSPYHKSQPDRVRVLKGRQKKLPNAYATRDTQFILPHITQGPHLGLLLDVMKAEDSFVRKELQKLYRYDFQEVTYLNNRLTYVFTFRPKEKFLDYAFFQGKVFIDMENLAIVRATFAYTERGIILYNRTSEKLKLKNREFEVNYMEYHGKWYLQDARVMNHYIFPPLARTLYSSHTFLTTEIINDQVEGFPVNQSLGLNEAFVETVEILDENFWEEYNVVPVEKE